MTLERRRDPRYALERPVKLQCDQTGARYLPGQMVNISSGGALLTVDHPKHLQMGQEIRLAIASSMHQALLEADDAVTGVVIRCLGCGETQHVAVRFHQSHLIAEAG